MSDLSPVATPPVPVTPPAPEAQPAEPQSIADHAEQFDPTLAPVDATPAPIEPAPDRRRHRARSQQAGAQDAPRIRELTARAKAAEERAASLEAKYQQSSPTPTTQAPPPQAPANAGMPVSAYAEPEPTLEAFIGKSEDPYLAHARALAAYDRRRESFDAAQATYQQQKLQAWSQRVNESVTKHPDYQQVAFAPTPIQPGSPIDAFIMEDDAGAELLYHLHAHREELDNLLRMPVLQQVKHLSLLSQRLLSESSAAAGSNGAVPGGTRFIPPPKPPTPLRTEAQRGSPASPPTDGSLSIAEHARAFSPNKR